MPQQGRAKQCQLSHDPCNKVALCYLAAGPASTPSFPFSFPDHTGHLALWAEIWFRPVVSNFRKPASSTVPGR